MKKLFAILLAVLTVCAFCLSASAASADLSGHTYTAYQIFSGKQNESTDLADIDWGTNIKSADFLSALQASSDFGTTNAFAACETAEDVASAMEGWSDNSAMAKAFAKIAFDNLTGTGVAAESGTTEIDAGYYLVVDTTEDAKVYNLALLQQTKKGTFTIANKVDVPEVTKQLSDAGGLTCTETGEDHVHGKACYTWVDADQVAIGDTVVFHIAGTVPTSAADYDYYYYIIEDTLSAGLTFTEGSLSAAIDNTAAKEGTDYSLNFGTNGKTFELALHNAKAYAGKTVDVLYAATLNTGAVIGTDGNPNEVSVLFSSDPNFKYNSTKNPVTSYTPGEEGEPDDKDKPGFPKPKDPGDTTKIPTDETPKDITLTYTAALKISKVDQSGDPLKGAAFTLTGVGYNKTDSVDDSGILTFEGLCAGAYTLTESVTPDGYNTIEPVTFEITCGLPESVATGEETCTWTSDNADITYSADDDAFSITVVNQKGSVLPETGGIGTPVFYILGGLLVVVAGVLLIVKKRMSTEK